MGWIQENVRQHLNQYRVHMRHVLCHVDLAVGSGLKQASYSLVHLDEPREQRMVNGSREMRKS